MTNTQVLAKTNQRRMQDREKTLVRGAHYPHGASPAHIALDVMPADGKRGRERP